MGSWSVSCGISNIAITSGQECVLLALKEARSEERKWQAATLPIFGEYNDYGGIKNIVEDENTKLIEDHFGITIDEFATFLVDGKFTYDRDEAKDVAKKMKNFDEAKEWRFMWIDKQVYDFMIVSYDNYHKGYNNYGTPKMLTDFGFHLVKGAKIKNYDPSRFNQLWKKDYLELYSDGSTLLSQKDEYIYHFGKGKKNKTSLEHYFDVPKEFDYLKGMMSHESWRTKSKVDALEELSFIIAPKYYVNRISLTLADKKLFDKYCSNLNSFGDIMASLINVVRNLHPMSGQFSPHVLYLTPQCGEYSEHQKLLEKFAEINKSYISEEEDDEEEL